MKRIIYGSMGFLSLLGLIGVFTPEKSFLAFFAFAVDFQYFFAKTDEMFEQYMDKSAAMGFFAGMFVMAVTTLVYLISSTAHLALMKGLAFGWAAAVIVHALSTVYYGMKENIGAK